LTVSSSWDVSSDAELITAVRSGDSAAFGVLYERHSGAARAVAHQYSNTAADADDSVAEAFSRVFTAIQTGGGPDVAFRAYLFTVIRRVALQGAHSGRRTQATDDLDALEAAFGLGESTEDPTFAGFERSVVSRAYKSLPERWQAVLWYTEVEQLNAAQIAPVLGLSANGVAALAYRAREGLRQAYLQQHLASPASEACTIVNAKLGAYVRGGLAKRETALVESHLEECGDCRALVLELGDVNHGMRAIIAPLVLGAVAVGVLQGVGFGGAIGTGAAAGAGGAAAGSSVSVGSGSLVGAGTSSLAAAGMAAGGVAALSALAGAQSAGASTAGASSSATSGASSGGSGLAALIGSVPVGAVGVAAAGLVVALAIGVSGMLGLFSGDPVSPLADGGIDVGQDEGAGSDEPVAPPTDPADDDADVDVDPTVVPAAPPALPGIPGPSVPAPAATTPPTDQPTTPPAEPTTPPDDPTIPPDDPTIPPDDPTIPPPALVMTSGLGGSTLVAGTPQLIQFDVHNPRTTAVGPVHTELTFPPGSGLALEAFDTAPLAGPGARLPFAVTSGWTCTTVVTAEAEVATCTLATLAPGATSELRTSLTVDDAVVDGERDLAVASRVWADPDTPAPATPMTLRVASAPAVLTVDGPDGGDAYVRAGSPRGLAFSIANTGRTTASGVTAAVELPEAVFWDGEVPGTDWTCTGTTGAHGTVACALDPAVVLAPGATTELVVRVTAQGAGTREVRADVEAENGRGGITEATTTTTITAVVGSIAIFADPVTIESGGVSAPVPITVVNLSDAKVTGLQVSVFKTGGPLVWSPPVPEDVAWSCAKAGTGVDCLPADGSLSAGESTTLYPRVQTPSSADAQAWGSTVRVSITGMTIDQPITVTVRRSATAAESALVTWFAAL